MNDFSGFVANATNMPDGNAAMSSYLIFLTNRVGRLLGNQIRQQMRDADFADLNGTHMGLLADLWEEDGQRQQDLAISTIKDKGTIARAIQSLEKRGLLVRKSDPADRRNKRIFLTQRGTEFHRRLLPFVAETERTAVDGISDSDLDTCRSVLERIYHSLHTTQSSEASASVITPDKDAQS